MIAQAGVGKSLLSLDILVALALGKPVLGHSARDPVAVMYIDQENPQAELVSRLRSLGYSPADLAGSRLLYFSFPDLPPLDTIGGGRVLALEVENYDPELIVFDSVSRFVGGKEDVADTWQDFYRYSMLPLRRQGRTVLRLDHQGHDTAKSARGSSAKRDDVDVAWVMKRRGNDIELKLDKGRGLGHSAKVELRRHSNPLRHLLVSDSTRSTDASTAGECIRALNRLDVPLATTRADARAILEANRYRFSNAALGEALKARRPSAS